MRGCGSGAGVQCCTLTEACVQRGGTWSTPVLHLPVAPPASLPAVQDSVRLLAVESCSAFAGALSPEDANMHLLPVINKFAQVRGTGCKGSQGNMDNKLDGTNNWRLSQAGFTDSACLLAPSALQAAKYQQMQREPCLLSSLPVPSMRGQSTPVLLFPQDKSWRVRYNVAHQLVQLCENLGKEATRYLRCWEPHTEQIPKYSTLTSLKNQLTE